MTGGMGGISKLAADATCPAQPGRARRSSMLPPRGRRNGGTGDGPTELAIPSGGAGGGRCEGGTIPPPEGGPKPLGVCDEGVLFGEAMREAIERCE